LVKVALLPSVLPNAAGTAGDAAMIGDRGAHAGDHAGAAAAAIAIFRITAGAAADLAVIRQRDVNAGIDTVAAQPARPGRRIKTVATGTADDRPRIAERREQRHAQAARAANGRG
jgi:hypothetical protein